MNGKRVGVIGGGQLAWMMGIESPNLGVELIVQTPNQNDPAVKMSHDVILADVNDANATAKLAQMCDVITFENEFIDHGALQEISCGGVNFRPSLKSLAPLLDKYDQRKYLQSISIPVPKFGLFSSQEDIISNYKFPLVLKARRHGYDGQGTFIVKDILGLKKLAKSVPIDKLLIEEFIPFERELGVIAARNISGDLAIYPVTETNQVNQVCAWTITPANVTTKVAQLVVEIANKILNQLEVVGVFGIEFFLTADNQVLVNEIAPRTHNSGHYTLDGCETSQFAMQLQAVTGMPFSSPDLKSAGALMVNLLGFEESDSEYLEKRAHLLAIPNSFVHWYGKDSRPGRKLGHVTVVLNETELVEARSIIEYIESLWYEN